MSNQLLDLDCLCALFVSGPDKDKVIAEARKTIEGAYGERGELIVVDVTERPAIAEDENIHNTPCIVRYWPEPMSQLLDLNDLEHLQEFVHGTGKDC